jgi:signal transduction histidine kinase
MFKPAILKKLTIVILAVSLGSILVLGLTINLALNRQFQDYLTRNESARQEQIVKMLADFYRGNGGWNGLLNGAGFGPGGFMGNLRFVTDRNNQVVIASRHFRMIRRRNEEQLTSRAITVDGAKVGTAYFGQNIIQNILTQQDRIFRGTINRSIFLAILITGFLSFLVAVLFAKRFSQPITAMNRIAKNMTTGNLDTRVQKLPGDEIGELGASLNSLAERLQQVDELRKKMTADVAHDLRTPLTTVKSHLEGIIDQVIPASNENLESLLEEINRLTALVDDLQAVAIADTAIHHFQTEPIELKSFLEDLLRKMSPLFKERHIDLKLEECRPVTLALDRSALTKILQNLLANALKFTPGGKQVTVKASRLSQSVVIEVRDQGIGISGQDLPYIFERFYRADPSRNRESGGFGLGLTIVKELMEAMGGTVEVESVLDKGSTFTIRLPIKV